MFDLDDYSYQKFESVQLGEDSLAKKTFIGCEFTSCQFEGTDFTQATFEDCLFRDCALYTVNLNGASWVEVELDGCKLVNVNFSLLNQMITSFGFKVCKIISCTFDDMSLVKTRFVESSFDDTMFYHCQLREADFEDSEFFNTRFEDCKLEKARFVGAEGLQLDIKHNNITKAVFDSRSAMSLLESLDITIV